jgi:hypothetical protein
LDSLFKKTYERVLNVFALTPHPLLHDIRGLLRCLHHIVRLVTKVFILFILQNNIFWLVRKIDLLTYLQNIISNLLPSFNSSNQLIQFPLLTAFLLFPAKGFTSAFQLEIYFYLNSGFLGGSSYLSRYSLYVMEELNLFLFA